MARVPNNPLLFYVQHGQFDGTGTAFSDLTLRDLFAAAALPTAQAFAGSHATKEELAVRAFDVADEMLAERERREQRDELVRKGQS